MFVKPNVAIAPALHIRADRRHGTSSMGSLTCAAPTVALQATSVGHRCWKYVMLTLLTLSMRPFLASHTPARRRCAVWRTSKEVVPLPLRTRRGSVECRVSNGRRLVCWLGCHRALGIDKGGKVLPANWRAVRLPSRQIPDITRRRNARGARGITRLSERPWWR